MTEADLADAFGVPPAETTLASFRRQWEAEVTNTTAKEERDRRERTAERARQGSVARKTLLAL